MNQSTPEANPLHCDPCKKTYFNKHTFESHKTGKQHKKNVQETETSSIYSNDEKKDLYCDACKKTYLDEHSFVTHLPGKNHKMNVSLMEKDTSCIEDEE